MLPALMLSTPAPLPHILSPPWDQPPARTSGRISKATAEALPARGPSGAGAADSAEAAWSAAAEGAPAACRWPSPAAASAPGEAAPPRKDGAPTSPADMAPQATESRTMARIPGMATEATLGGDCRAVRTLATLGGG